MAKEELQAEVCCVCKTKVDLALCPECHLSLCGKHDMHQCFPKHETQFQKQIDEARNRRELGFGIIYVGMVFVMLFGIGFLVGILTSIVFKDRSSWVGENYVAFTSVLIVAGALIVLGNVIAWYFDSQLRKSGVRMRSIRPQTAKKDR